MSRFARAKALAEVRVPGRSKCSKSPSEQFPSKRFKDQAAHEVAPVRDSERGAMCDKCVELDTKIERYQRILLLIGDQVTVDRTKELIAELLAQKVALHPEQDE